MLSITTPLTSHIKTFALAAVVLTSVLFTIDEGQISLLWMVSPAHWFVFTIYAAVIFLSQWSIQQIAALLLENPPRPLLSVALGSGLGLTVLWQMLS
ncbi:MAG: hypothetical protein GC193_07930 [Cryomorphaceae bacterium]|nr:hypothetical protein [Cryomorphaceae bacterium]